jgi:glucan phosphoethanolaminetransferase (alkaline phosphatase superfamily)
MEMADILKSDWKYILKHAAILILISIIASFFWVLAVGGYDLTTSLLWIIIISIVLPVLYGHFIIRGSKPFKKAVLISVLYIVLTVVIVFAVKLSPVYSTLAQQGITTLTIANGILPVNPTTMIFGYCRLNEGFESYAVLKQCPVPYVLVMIASFLIFLGSMALGIFIRTKRQITSKPAFQPQPNQQQPTQTPAR